MENGFKWWILTTEIDELSQSILEGTLKVIDCRYISYMWTSVMIYSVYLQDVFISNVRADQIGTFIRVNHHNHPLHLPFCSTLQQILCLIFNGFFGGQMILYVSVRPVRERGIFDLMKLLHILRFKNWFYIKHPHFNLSRPQILR